VQAESTHALDNESGGVVSWAWQQQFVTRVSFMPAGGQWETAREIFDGMISNSCKPDAITYATLIAALDRGGQWGHALQVRPTTMQHPGIIL
jgi:hypothetical protein